MTSIGNYKRQVSNDSAHFITTASLIDKIFTSPLGSPAPWASTGSVTATAGSAYVSTVSSAGALLRDMGKTVVSSGAYFRKVQLVVPQGPVASQARAGLTSTFGVAGPAPSGGVIPDYLTGYIQLGFEGGGIPAPVAKYGF